MPQPNALPCGDAMFARPIAVVLALAVLNACGKPDFEVEPPRNLGDFSLGFAVATAKNAQKVPISRDATAEEWEKVLQEALDARFRRYDTGTRLYNIGVTVDGYALAPPGIPVLAAPKSVLVVTTAVFDDAEQRMLNADGKGKQITAFERGSSDTFIGSGLTRSKRQQMEELAFVAVREIEHWLTQNPEWFGLPPLPQQATAQR
jgi:hypothetical protein